MLLFATPPTGAAAWFFGIEQAGDVHGALRIALFFLAALYIVGAFAEQIVFRNNLLGRMTGL